MFNRFLKQHSDKLYFVFRLMIGALFFLAGSTKVFGWFGGTPVPIPLFSLFWFAGAIEVVVGVLLVIGYQARFAASFAAIEMVFAWFIGHAPQGWNPLTNNGLPALMFFAAFLAIAAMGARAYSLDAKLEKR